MSERTVEEYLETIGALEERESPVSTTAIANGIGVSLASVSEMIRRLAEKGLVEHTPYGGAKLTEPGRERFIRLTRRHRLWEVFLNRHLGMSWEEVYEPACSLEHATSDLVEDKLDEFLGYPETCPHGSQIPDANLEHPARSGAIMADLEAGQSARILGVIIESDAEFLRYLGGQGLTPGAEIKVLEKAPYDGTLTVEAGGSPRAIGREAASLITVQPL